MVWASRVLECETVSLLLKPLCGVEDALLLEPTYHYQIYFFKSFISIGVTASACEECFTSYVFGSSWLSEDVLLFSKRMDFGQ